MKEGANIWIKLTERFTEDRKMHEAYGQSSVGCLSLVESGSLWSKELSLSSCFCFVISILVLLEYWLLTYLNDFLLGKGT